MTPQTNSRAVVIGAGMAGLLAARAVSESFDRVTVVERDTLPDTPTARRCVPQGRHAHTLTVRGKDVLEELFPGLTDILLEHSAPTGDLQADFRLVVDGHRFAKGVSGIRHMLVSRPLLEWQLRNSVQAIPNVEILDRCAVTTIATDPRTQAVTAVIVDSTAHRLTDHRIAADLAVDASGRSSQVQGWLESQGFPRPDEQRLSINLTYATRHYRREPSHLYGDLGLLVGASPALPRAGAILAQEHNSWIITLAGYGADAPSLDEEQFVEFAASLPAPEFADLLRHAEPLDTAVHYRIPTTVRRNFTAAHLPTGYVPFGDTLCCFNPVYGQGMSVAAVESLILRQCCAGDRGTLAGRFLRRIEPTLDEAWDMSANTDLRMPFIDGERTTKTKLTNAYLTRLYRAAATDARVGAAFLRVTNLLDHPAALMNPPPRHSRGCCGATDSAGRTTNRPPPRERPARSPATASSRSDVQLTHIPSVVARSSMSGNPSDDISSTPEENEPERKVEQRRRFARPQHFPLRHPPPCLPRQQPIRRSIRGTRNSAGATEPSRNATGLPSTSYEATRGKPRERGTRESAPPRAGHLEPAGITKGTIIMPVTEQSVVIARPASEVWDFISDAKNWPSWEASSLECEQITDGEPEVGTRWRGINRILGRQFEWVTEYTEYQPVKLATSKSVDGKINFTATTRLEEVDGGTLFTYRIDSESGLGGVFGKVADPIVNKVYSRMVRASLDNLADLLTTDR